MVATFKYYLICVKLCLFDNPKHVKESLKKSDSRIFASLNLNSHHTSQS